MAFSLNKIMLIGNLGKDAETRFTTSNVSVTSFSLATSNSYKGKDGNWVDETTWHNIVSFNLSDYFKDGLKKGKKVYVEGRLTKRDYTDKDNIKRYMTEVISDKIILLEGRDEHAEYPKEAAASNHVSEDIPVEENDDLPF